MTTLRITGKDYRKQYKELQKEVKGLENQILSRALFLCNQYPEIIIYYNYSGGKYNTTAKTILEYYQEYGTEHLTTDLCIDAIETIETELAKKELYKQGNLF